MPLLKKSYSRTSFSRNWCEKNWPELFHVKDHSIYKRCFAQYKDAELQYMTYPLLFKFIVHYIAAIPEMTEMKYELNDNTIYETVIESIAEDTVHEILDTGKIKKKQKIDELTFIFQIIPQLGSGKLKHKRKISTAMNGRRHTIGCLAHLSPTSARRKSIADHDRDHRMNTFYRKMHRNKGKMSKRGDNKLHDDIVSYRRMFEDLLIFYPIGQLLAKFQRKRIANIRQIMKTKEEERTSTQLKQIIQWISPALHANASEQIPAGSQRALNIARALILAEYKEKQVIFLKGYQATNFFIILHGAIAVFKGAVSDNKHVITLQRGTGFGGLALASDEPQSNSCIAVEQTLIAILSKENYHTLMQPSYETNPKEKYKTLKRCKLLKWTSPHLLKELSLFAVTKYYKRGSLIVQQGMIADDGVYFIKTGLVRLVREIKPQIYKQTIQIHTKQKNKIQDKQICPVFIDIDHLQHPQTFGWEALLTAYPSICSIIAESNVVVYVINKSSLLHKLDTKSLQTIYDSLAEFPCDMKLADQLFLSEKWLRYRQSIFREVRVAREFRTHKIKQHQRGSLTTFLNLSGFSFDKNQQLDVQQTVKKLNPRKIKQKRRLSKRGKAIFTSEENWNKIRSMFRPTNAMDIITKPGFVKSKNIENSSNGKVKINNEAYNIPMKHLRTKQSTSLNEETHFKRPQTPRSFRIIRERNKQKYNYYVGRAHPRLLKIPGYSWLTNDQQSNIYKSFTFQRQKWLIRSNAEDDQKQKRKKKMFEELEKHLES